MKNRKDGLPHIPESTGRLASRTSFLSGDIRAYYGPGQRPDAGESGLYVPPTDWPAAGTLLRMPQVAWLGLHILVPGIFRFASLPGINPITHTCNSLASVPVAYQGAYYANGAAEFTAVSASPSWNAAAASQVSDFPSSFGTWIAMDPLPDGTDQWHIVTGDITAGSIDKTIPTPMPAERARLLSAFRGARDILADIRPNRTWAVIVDPWGDGDPDGTSFNQHDAFFSGIPGLYWPMMAPSDAEVDAYLGLDWMHIYCGYAAKTDIMLYHWDDSFTLADFASARASTLPLAARAGPNFYGWSTRYFWTNLSLSSFSPVGDAPAASYAPPTGYFAKGIFPEVTDDHDMHVPGPYVLGWTEVFADSQAVQDLMDAWYAGLQLNVDADNAFNAGIQPANRDALRADALSLSAAGLDALAVAETSVVTAEYLVQRIADRFGFDPGTGEDIG